MKRYRILRAALIVLRWLALRYRINFDNAVESSAKPFAARRAKGAL